MEQTKPSKEPTRDYQALSTTPWALWDTLHARRSHRRYLPIELDTETVAGLRSTVGLACEARGAPMDSVVVVTDPEKVTELRKRAYKGFSGKINMWLLRAPLAAELVMNLPASDVHAHRPVDLPKTVMAIEDVVLWLTERGFGTCWLAGVNEREVKGAAGLAAEQAVSAIISVGKPAVQAPRTASMAGISYRMMSRRRKPLSHIACEERTSVPDRVPEFSPGGFSALDSGVEALLERLRDNDGPRAADPDTLDLVIDACLEAGRTAPSANNSQPWLFVVLRDRSRLDRLAGLCALPDTCTAALVAAGLSRRIESLWEKPFWDIDVPIAMSHVSLMAASMGRLPAVITDGIDEEGIVGLTGLASGMRVAGVISL
jgi:nitroreductase